MTKPEWPRTLRAKNVRQHYPEFIARIESAATANQRDPLSRDSPVTLREISKENARAIMFLDVLPDQESLVAPNAVSIAQAYFQPEAWFRAIYADETPVGFAMLEDWSQVESQVPRPETALHNGERYVYLWRFMIDARYQQMGFGAKALAQLIDYAKSRPDVNLMLLSFVPNEHNPEGFYQRFGFERTGEKDGDELIMALRLV
jgi:diamine N-acetyltransferase